MISALRSRLALFLFIAVGGNACTGLVAGPERQSVTPVPASRDSAYVRARRGLQGESFTFDVVDSTAGRLVGTRWPGASAKQGSAEACHISAALQIKGNGNESEVAATSRWVAPVVMEEQAPDVCEKERIALLERIAQVLVPPATP